MNSTEIIVAVVGVFGSTILAYFAYRRGSQADKDLQENKAVNQVYEGYGGLLQRITADNQDLRERLAETVRRLEVAEARIDELLIQVRKGSQ